MRTFCQTTFGRHQTILAVMIVVQLTVLYIVLNTCQCSQKAFPLVHLTRSSVREPIRKSAVKAPLTKSSVKAPITKSSIKRAPPVGDVSPNLLPRNGTTKAPVKNKRILYWTTYWQSEDFLGKGRQPFIRNRCKESRCEFTSAKGTYLASDAIFFHLRRVKNLSDLPVHRRPNQLYIFIEMEPPPNARERRNYFHGIFNLSMTYHRDSDFPRPLGLTVPLTKEEKGEVLATWPENFAQNKSKLIFWAVSRCDSESGRDWYANQLQRYVPLDIYGECGNMSCPRSPFCTEFLHRQYKFYLAFENSVCKDYITEKAWRPLTKNVVPIVLGGGDYAAVLPPKSYIDVRNFSSIKALADYLLLLDNNDHLYNQYFTWQKDFQVVTSKKTTYGDSLCKLCEYLHDDNKQPRVVQDLNYFFDESTLCMDKETYFKNITEFHAST